MTCQELRLYFEDPLRMDAEFRDEAEHLAHCSECTRFVEERRELGAGLRGIRGSIPQPSTALDSTVLASYRRQIANVAVGIPRNENRVVWATRVRSIFQGRAAVVGWSAAAALALAAALVIHPPRNAQNATAKIGIAHPSSQSLPVTQMKTAQHVSPGATASIKTAGPHLDHQSRSVPAAVREDAVTEEFRSLMYCDPLSCGGEMELIRVRLPSAAGARGPVSPADDRIIYADVLVGPDGVARGIRVVQ